jgi:hypothetical protein
LRAVPGVAAGVVALLYVVGVTFEAGELRGAHVSASVVLPRLPLQQLLERGVAAAGSAFLGLLVLIPFLVFVYAILALGERIMDADLARTRERAAAVSRETDPKRRATLVDQLRQRRAKAVWNIGVGVIVVLLGAAWTFLLGPPIIGVSVLVAAAGAVMLRSRFSRRGRALFTIPVLLAGFLTAAYVEPKQLPRVRLVMRTGASISGLLAGSTDNTWYVAGTRGDLSVVRADSVREARVTAPPRWHLKSGLEIVDAPWHPGRWSTWPAVRT